MKTQIKEITPTWAAQILETRNPNNRNISPRIVQKYSSDMLNGDWGLTHQGIAFDENGDLMDGQHRLAAVVSAKKPIMMMVTTGIPSTFKNNGHTSSTFACIDGVKPRNPATNLEILKYKNTKAVASIARGAGMLCMGDARLIVTASATEQIVKFMSPSAEQIASLQGGPKIVRLRASALAAVAFYHTSNPGRAEEFMIEAMTVSGAKGSPSRALANWITRHPPTGGTQQMELLYVTASALFHNSRNSKIEKLYGSEESLRWLQSQNHALKKQIESLFKQ